MKKLLALTLSLASLGFAATSAEAKTSASSIAPASTVAVAPQNIRIQLGGGRRRNDRFNDRFRYNHVRVVTQSRLVRFGRQLFRETYQITTWPNGRTQTQVISRVRVR